MTNAASAYDGLRLKLNAPDCSKRSPRSNVCNGSKADISIQLLDGIYASQLQAMWRSSGEQVRQLPQVNSISLLERELAYVVLLDMVITAEADRPTIGRLERYAAIGVPADMGALDRASEAARHAAVMTAHPGTVSRTLATARLAGLLALKPVREL